MERKREQWLLLLWSGALMAVFLSQVVRREALFVSVSCLVCHQREIQTEETGCQTGITQPQCTQAVP